jgi:hypothetical protein
LLLFDRPLTPRERADLEGWIFGRWSAHVARLGLGTISRANGVDLRTVTTQEGLGDYLTTVEGGWTAGLEIARGDVKSSTPLQLLARLVETGESKWLALWLEYERATRGRAATMWSRGLRQRFAIALTTDEELAASEGLDLTLFRALFQGSEWARLHRDGTVPAVLSAIEHVAAAWLFTASTLGVVAQPLDTPRGGERWDADGKRDGALCATGHSRPDSS